MGSRSSKWPRLLLFWMQSPNPKNLTIPFKPTVLEKFFYGNLLTYLWCDLAMLVGLKQLFSSPHSGTAGELQQLSMEVGALNEKVKATSLGSLMAQGRQDSIQISSFYYNGQVSAINLHSILLITRSPKLMLWAIMVEVLGAYEETYKTYLHPINDLEQEGPWKLPPLSLKIDTLIRTTGREIGLFLGCSTTDTVTGRATVRPLL